MFESEQASIDGTLLFYREGKGYHKGEMICICLKSLLVFRVYLIIKPAECQDYRLWEVGSIRTEWPLSRSKWKTAITRNSGRAGQVGLQMPKHRQRALTLLYCSTVKWLQFMKTYYMFHEVLEEKMTKAPNVGNVIYLDLISELSMCTERLHHVQTWWHMLF